MFSVTTLFHIEYKYNFWVKLAAVTDRSVRSTENPLDTKSVLALQLRHIPLAQCEAGTVRRALFRETSVVTKKEIVKAISEEIGLTQLKTKEIVQKTFDAIVETLVRDGRIELRNFGVFEVKKRAARKARNPRTGDKVFVPEKFVVTFKPGKEMEEKVLQMEVEAAQSALAQQHGTQAAGGETPPGTNASNTESGNTNSLPGQTAYPNSVASVSSHDSHNPG